MRLSDENNRLWIMFRLHRSDFCVSSETVDSIVIPEKLNSLPCAPSYFSGLLERGGALIPVIDMRVLFHLPSLEQCVEEFAQMKTMHVEWTQALRTAVKTNTPFTKPVDPHRCKFGIWHDHFETDNFSLNYILNKIVGPHERIHLCGAEINAMMSRGDMSKAEERLEEAEEICLKEIVPLLDQLIAVYREANRGIVLVVSSRDRHAGLLVDEITGMIPAAQTMPQELPRGDDSYLAGVVLNGRHPLLHVDVKKLPFLNEGEPCFWPSQFRDSQA